MTVTETLTVDTITERRIAKTIDHSLLKPELTVDESSPGARSPPPTTSPRCVAARSTSNAAATRWPARMSS